MSLPFEPYIPAIRAREVLASLKGGTRIAHGTLRRLMRQHGLPHHPDPFGGDHPVFLVSEIYEWDRQRRAGVAGPIRRGPGRPCKGGINLSK